MTPRQLSHELRHGTHPDLRRRRGIVGLSLLSAGAMGVIALYQMGIIRHIPEPPLPRLDADEVDGSDQAYSYGSMPDGVLGLRSYATTAALAAMGGADRARKHPWIPLALGAKLLFDAGVAGKLTWDQWAKHRKFCSWCLLSAAATFAMLPLGFPEARTAMRQMTGNLQKEGPSGIARSAWERTRRAVTSS